MSSYLTARADGSDAELQLSLSDETGGENFLRLEAAGRLVLSLHTRRTSEDLRALNAEFNGAKIVLELAGSGDPRVRGTIGGVELSEGQASAVTAKGTALPDFELPELSTLPLEELAREMDAQVQAATSTTEWSRPHDGCKDCKWECFRSYVQCVSACGDIGTPIGAVCLVRCILDADRCDRACPC